MPRLIVLLIMAPLILVACGKSVSDKDVHWLTVHEAQVAIKTPSGSWITESKPNVWVDPRDAAYYTVGHIPGALNIQLSDPDASGRLDTYGTIVVYGESYKAPIADAMIKTLISKGHDDVKGLELGYAGWIAAGEKLDKGTDPGRITESTKIDRWHRVNVDQD
jgi:rhodanese-related sulfurtransferase